jgi:hypothetical protein
MNATRTETWNRYDKITALSLAVAALGLYSLTLAPTVLEADAGEFQFVPWLPGIAHPTGYPLYVLAGWTWSHLLPVGEVAWRMNLLSAVFAAMTVGMVYGLARCLLDIALPALPLPARLLGGGLAAATFAVTATFWSQALVAEVYTLHTLLVTAILWLTLKSVYAPAAWTTRTLGFVFGLGLSHHRTTLLLAPALLLFFWLNRRKTSKVSQTSQVLPGLAGPRETSEVSSKARIWLNHALYLLLPLLLYLYLPLVAPLTPYTTLSLSETQTLTLYENSFSGFWQHVAGTVFAGEIQPTAVGFERLALTWEFLRQQVGWVGATLALSGLWVLWQQRSYDLLILTGVAFLTIIAFNWVYFIGDVFVLFTPAWLILCLWVALGSGGLANLAATRLVRHKMGVSDEITFESLRQRLQQNLYGLVACGLMVFFFALPLALLVTRYSLVDQGQNRATRTRWQEILKEAIPTSAVLLSNDRNEIMPLWYYQYVEGRRPDLLGLFPLIVPDPAYNNIGRTLDQALLSGRPVYAIKLMEGLSVKADILPENKLFRLLPISKSPRSPSRVTFAGEGLVGKLALSGYDLPSATVRAGEKVNLTLYWQVVEPLSQNYTSYIHLVGPDGQTLAQSDHLPGGDYYPSRYWQAGETLRDQHELLVPAGAPPGNYQAQVGLYEQPEPGVIRGLGNGAAVTQIVVRK